MLTQHYLNLQPRQTRIRCEARVDVTVWNGIKNMFYINFIRQWTTFVNLPNWQLCRIEEDILMSIPIPPTQTSSDQFYVKVFMQVPYV